MTPGFFPAASQAVVESVSHIISAYPNEQVSNVKIILINWKVLSTENHLVRHSSSLW